MYLESYIKLSPFTHIFIKVSPPKDSSVKLFRFWSLPQPESSAAEVHKSGKACSSFSMFRRSMNAISDGH